MKLHYLLLITIHLSLFCTPSVSAQNKPCNNFTCAYLKAENFLKQAAYQKALDNLDSAEGYLTDTNTKEKEQIKQLRRRLFVAIEKEKEDAKRARDEAKRQTGIAQKALAQADNARQKAQDVLDKIYFYDGKFGLAYDKVKEKYGFIDKDLNIKIDFIYEEALPFDRDDYSKVKLNGDYFLIDTFGNNYKLATDINHLDSNITALDLRGTILKEIPQLVFQHSQLRILLMRIIPPSYKQSNLPPEIGKLINLTDLGLSNLRLTSIPVEIEKLNNLHKLSFGSNNLISLPAEIGKLTCLSELDLSLNDFKSLPIGIGKLTNLKKLDLSYNNLTSLPNEIGNLTNLTDLNLYGNELTSLPIEIGRLTNLPELDLSLSNLTSLPTEIGQLINLTTLDLSHNKLTTLPREIGNLTNLVYLNLYGNKLTNLPIEIEKLSNLNDLYLWGNPISIEEQDKIKKLLPNCAINFNKFYPPPVKKVKNVKK